jgi:hypothetical protein
MRRYFLSTHSRIHTTSSLAAIASVPTSVVTLAMTPFAHGERRPLEAIGRGAETVLGPNRETCVCGQDALMGKGGSVDPTGRITPAVSHGTSNPGKLIRLGSADAITASGHAPPQESGHMTVSDHRLAMTLLKSLRPGGHPHKTPPSRPATPQHRGAQICDTLKRDRCPGLFVHERSGGLNGAVVCVTRCMADAVRVPTQSRQGCATKHQPPRPAMMGAPIPVDRADAELLRCTAGAEIDRAAGHHMDRGKPRAAQRLLVWQD